MIGFEDPVTVLEDIKLSGSGIEIMKLEDKITRLVNEINDNNNSNNDVDNTVIITRIT